MSTENEDTSNIITHRAGPRNYNNKIRNMFTGFEIVGNDRVSDPVAMNDRQELKDREESLDATRASRDVARTKYNDSRSEMTAFEKLMVQSTEAQNAVTPTSEQAAALVLLDQTVSTITLDQSDGMTEREKRMNKSAAHLVELKKTVEEDRKSWNALTKEYDECLSFINRLKDRLAKGKTNEAAIHGNTLNYVPTRENLSMLPGTTDNMREVWSQFDGDNLLNLKFSTLKASLTKLRRSVSDDLLRLETGKRRHFPFFLIIYEKLFYRHSRARCQSMVGSRT